MQRSDVVLADLKPFILELQHRSKDTSIVFVAASDVSSVLPCCKQSLGFKNASVSKLWTAAHWKNDSCREYWKDIHLVCVRKYRPNSTYAAVDEVKDALADQECIFLHEMPPALSPLRRTSLTKSVLGAKTPASVSANSNNQSSATRTPRSVSSSSKLSTVSPRTGKDEPSPVQKSSSIKAIKPRSSEPMVSATKSTNVRSPIITRRRSNTALHAGKPSASPNPPMPTTSSVLQKGTNGSANRPIVRKASDSCLSGGGARRISGVGMVPRSVSSTAIPTPVRRSSSIHLLGDISHGSPSSPIEQSKLLRASLRRPKAPPVLREMAIQTDPTRAEQDQLLDALVELEGHFDALKVEHEDALRHISELEKDNRRLRRQKGGIEEETDKLKEKKTELEGTVQDLKRINANLIDETGWIIVSKTEQEEKIKSLEMENEKLVAQYQMLSNQRKELEGMALSTREQLNDALEEISRLQVAAAARLMVQNEAETTPLNHMVTPMKTPITRFKETFDPATVYRTPLVTPPHQTRSVGRGYSTPIKEHATPVAVVQAAGAPRSVKKVRTPLTGSLKKNKHGFRFWRRIAKRRMMS